MSDPPSLAGPEMAQRFQLAPGFQGPPVRMPGARDTNCNPKKCISACLCLPAKCLSWWALTSVLRESKASGKKPPCLTGQPHLGDSQVVSSLPFKAEATSLPTLQALKSFLAPPSCVSMDTYHPEGVPPCFGRILKLVSEITRLDNFAHCGKAGDSGRENIAVILHQPCSRSFFSLV